MNIQTQTTYYSAHMPLLVRTLLATTVLMSTAPAIGDSTVGNFDATANLANIVALARGSGSSAHVAVASVEQSSVAGGLSIKVKNGNLLSMALGHNSTSRIETGSVNNLSGSRLQIDILTGNILNLNKASNTAALVRVGSLSDTSIARRDLRVTVGNVINVSAAHAKGRVGTVLIGASVNGKDGR